MNMINEIRGTRGKVDQRLVIGLVAVAVIILAAVWFLTGEPEPEPIPAPGRTLDTVQPAETAAERGDSARVLIDELSSADGEPDYGAAYARAQEFRAQGQLADAQLLYFFAARGGHAAAAFDLATLYDPGLESQASSVMEEADPFQAYRWYGVASGAGHPEAGDRLAELRAWAERAAAAGDAEAERLLLQWE
jgi:hypothetical protein